jgi:hypothetical protein
MFAAFLLSAGALSDRVKSAESGDDAGHGAGEVGLCITLQTTIAPWL